ncbi:MAG TPA: PDZ domain-containing protein, partial [Myxococcota bacterium]|nr:PDZ domain-containing protein [Myxococcota bacterium]
AMAPAPPSDGKLGVRVADVDAGLQAQLGLAPNRYAVVRRVGLDSLAARAGVQVGDILLAVNGQDVASARTFAEGTGAMPSGAMVQLKVLRPATSETLTLLLHKP